MAKLALLLSLSSYIFHRKDSSHKVSIDADDVLLIKL